MEKLIQEINEIDPGTVEIKILKGFSLYKSGSLKESINILREVSSANENYQKVKFTLEKARKQNQLIEAAAAKTIENDHKEAINLLNQVILVDEKSRKINQAACFQRSMAYFSIGDSVQAYADFRKFETMNG